MNNFNATTQNAYSPTNQEHLENHKEAFDLTSDAWAGYKQWLGVGRQVQKGAKSCTIYMFCDKKMELSDEGKQKVKGGEKHPTKKVMKSIRVFNIDQTKEV